MFNDYDRNMTHFQKVKHISNNANWKKNTLLLSCAFTVSVGAENLKKWTHKIDSQIDLLNGLRISWCQIKQKTTKLLALLSYYGKLSQLNCELKMLQVWSDQYQNKVFCEGKFYLYITSLSNIIQPKIIID